MARTPARPRSSSRRELVIRPITGADPIVSPWLAALHETRRRTLEALEGLDGQALDFRLPGVDNSIGSLLYHVAAIELDWLHADIHAGAAWPTHMEAAFPSDVRDDDDRLTAVEGESLPVHLARLVLVRVELDRSLRSMDAADFVRPRVLEEYDVTPQWVVVHLLNHEAEHRSEIARLRASFDSWAEGGAPAQAASGSG